MKNNETKKEIFYPIGQVAQMFNISVATLRLYESEGLILPKKTPGRHRLYSEMDLNRLSCIRKMIDQKGFNLTGIRMMLSAVPCWEIKKCSKKDRSHCDVYVKEPTKPCWQVEVRGRICSEEECRTCAVYIQTSDCSDIKSILKKYWRAQTL